MGLASHRNPGDPGAIGGIEDRLMERVAALENELRELRAYIQGGRIDRIAVVSGLPTAGVEGRLLKVAGTDRPYLDNGSSFIQLL